MKSRYQIIKNILHPIVAGIFLMVFILPLMASGQDAMKKIAATVVDQQGKPITNATVFAHQSLALVATDENGAFEVDTKGDDVLTVSADGFVEQLVQLNEAGFDGTIVLPFLSKGMDENELVDMPFAEITRDRLVGAVSVVDGEELTRYPDLSLLNALAGRVPGLYSLQKSSTPGWNSPSMVIRGLSGMGNNAPIIIVDGIERSATELIPEEVESIQVYKDVTAKILYGSRAANGVIAVTTKRGKKNTKEATFNMEYGVMLPTSDPQWLDAANYAELYNEARENDGLSRYYSDEAIEAYRNGTNGVLYPNNDYHQRFLNNLISVGRVVSQFRGGGEKSTYYVNLGYTGTGGLEDISNPTTFNKLNIRGNLDVQLTDITKMKMDVAGRMEFRNSANMTTQNFFNALSSHRPNEYPLFFNDPANPDTDLLGGSYEHPNNIYGMSEEKGYKKQINRNVQFNLGLEFNLNKYLNGLSAETFLTYDTENMYRYGINENFASYKVLGTKVLPDGTEGYDYERLQLENRVYGKQTSMGNNILRRYGLVGQLNFERTFNDKHDILANMVMMHNSTDYQASTQNDLVLNYGLRVNYLFNKKYAAEANLSYMGSSKFEEGERFGLFPALGLGWILSEEGIFKDIDAINYLKLRVSGGEMGYDRSTGHFLYEDRWSTGGSVKFGNKNQTNVPLTSFNKYGNPGLTWEKAREFNAGVEGILFNRSLSFEFNYFNELRYDIITALGSQNPEYLGGSLPSYNYGEVANNGFEAEIVYHKRGKDLEFEMGANFVYSISDLTKANVLDYPDEMSYMSTIGQPQDVFTGYVADGFLTEADLANYHSTLGDVQAGDIKYVDLNDDGVIDNEDRKVIGNVFPRLSMGIHFDIKYKGFELYALGVANTGFEVMKNNRYYWAYGSRKYSEEVLNRWTPATASTATYPRLTSGNSNNNYTASTFWMEDAGFFKLKNVELSYSLPKDALSSLKMKKAKVFVRGTNLLSIGKFDNLDAENIDAGITDYPLLKTITGGVAVTF